MGGMGRMRRKMKEVGRMKRERVREGRWRS